MDPRGGLAIVEKKKVSFPLLGTDPDSIIQPIA
jgi:hypothetical protein